MRFFFVIVGMFLGFSEVFASDLSVGVGPTYAVPMGDSYQTLSPGPGGVLQLWSPFPFWCKSWVQLQSSVLYERFSVRNNTGIALNRMGILLGPRFNATVGDVRLFFATQLGSFVDSLLFSTGTSVGVNQLVFSGRVVSGVDFSFGERFGLVWEMPIMVLFPSGYLVWAPSLSLRVNL